MLIPRQGPCGKLCAVVGPKQFCREVDEDRGLPWHSALPHEAKPNARSPLTRVTAIATDLVVVTAGGPILETVAGNPTPQVFLKVVLEGIADYAVAALPADSPHECFSEPGSVAWSKNHRNAE